MGKKFDGADFSEIPEECVSNILALTSPKDACRSSAISRMFHVAADSDSVWEKFLPSDYEEIVSRSVSPLEFSTKKELYFRLCDSILIDHGSKCLTLDKSSGKKCFVMGATHLSITWGDDLRYWRKITLPESRFSEVMKLNYVWWFHINGSLNTRILSPKTTYIACLIVKFEEHCYGLGDTPTDVTIEIGSQVTKSIAILCPDKYLRRTSDWSDSDDEEVEVPDNARVPHDRYDGWMEIELGEFYTDDGDDGDMMINIMNFNAHVKAGLIVEGIELRPKE